MVKQRKKICVECGKETYIFSKGRCKFCASKSYAKKKNDRTNLNDFFKKEELKLSKKLICENCGVPLKSTFMRSNIAHILPKQRYKSVSDNPNNILYLCSFKDNGNNCHSHFDFGGNKQREKMPVFQTALKKVKYMLEENMIKENGSELSFYKKHLIKEQEKDSK
jgi:ribosomal protein L37E